MDKSLEELLVEYAKAFYSGEPITDLTTRILEKEIHIGFEMSTVTPDVVIIRFEQLQTGVKIYKGILLDAAGIRQVNRG